MTVTASAVIGLLVLTYLGFSKVPAGFVPSQDKQYLVAGYAMIRAEASVKPDVNLEYFDDEGDRLHMMFDFHVNQLCATLSLHDRHCRNASTHGSAGVGSLECAPPSIDARPTMASRILAARSARRYR